MSAIYLFSLGGVALATLTLVHALYLRNRPARYLMPALLALTVFIATAAAPFLPLDVARVIASMVLICVAVDHSHHDGGQHA